jgi:hypothetical protein
MSYILVDSQDQEVQVGAAVQFEPWVLVTDKNPKSTEHRTAIAEIIVPCEAYPEGMLKTHMDIKREGGITSWREYLPKCFGLRFVRIPATFGEL